MVSSATASVLICLLTTFLLTSAKQWKICVNTDDFRMSDNCKLQNQDNFATCVPVPDSVNCALKLQSDQAELTTVNAEQYYLISQFLNESVAIIDEIRDLNRLNDNFEFKTVVVVRKNFTELKNGAKYCHPGFYNDSKWTPRVAMEFERYILNDITVVNRSSIAIEHDLQKLQSFFGPSCRPGNWVDDKNYNIELQERFKSLTAICEENHFSQPYRNVLDCLLKGHGDVIYTDYHEFMNYFKMNELANRSDFKYLCRDGNSIAATQDPCAWITQPVAKIIAISSQENVIKQQLSEKLDAEKYSPLKYILKISNRTQQYPLLENKLESRYIGIERIKPESTVNATKVRWCVVSNMEHEKCKWLQQAVLTFGISPELDCVIGKNVVDCFEKIQQNQADLICSDTNYGYIARTVYGLTSIAYGNSDLKYAVLVVLQENNTSKIKTFENLKDSKACYPEYNGLVWRAVSRHMRQIPNILDNSTLPMFFKAICVPGVNEPSYGIVLDSESKQLCSLCPSGPQGNKYCNMDVTNIFSGDEGALNCLHSGGDVAFIRQQNIKESSGTYRVLCQNNTLATIPGLDVDDNCALTVVITNEIITRMNETANRNFHLFLSAITKWFGGNHTRFSAMNIFAPFNNQKDVIFKDHTFGFTFGESDEPVYVNYNNLLSDDAVFEQDGELSAGYYVLIFGSVFVILGMMGFVIYNVVMKSEYHRANRAEF